MLKFLCKSFSQLSLKEAHDLFELRSEVFVLEQKCVYQDIDGEDPNAHHILGKDSSNKIVAYARILPKGKSYASFVAIGRLVVSQKIRGNKHGHNLVKKSIEEAFKLDNRTPIKISAQAHLTSFYNKHGFIVDGKEYLEDGIPHIAMILKS